MKKIKKPILAATFAALTGCALAGAHETAETWFREDYSGFKVSSSTVWTTTAGTWTKESAADVSYYSNETGRVHLDTAGTEIKFAPPSNTRPTNSLVRVDCTMAFTVCLDEEDWLYDTAKDQHAAIGIRYREDGKTLTFFVWRARWKHGMDNPLSYGTWVDVSAPGITPEPNRLYTVTIENDQSCLPSRIRYSIDGVPLQDSAGTTWMAANSTLKPWEATNPKVTKRICFRGRGEVGEITATKAGCRTERAAVTFARPGVATAGSKISFSLRALDGQTVGANLSYRWYREDASMLRTEGAIAEAGATYAITEADYGHWIAVDVSDENGYAGTGRFWCSALPVAYIDVETNKFGVGTVFPQSKSITYDAHMLITGNAEYKQQYEGPITIHVRGNSTAGEDKKPYKIKLDKKTDLFGLGGGTKNKHWVLMANAYDESLMRNKVAMDLSERFGTVAMHSTWVDVILNGQFVGNYLLCQHIRVAPERINVYDWSTDMEEIAKSAVYVTGGDADALEAFLETNCCWMGTGKFTYLGTNYTVKAIKKKKGQIEKDGSVTVGYEDFSTDISGGYLFEIDPKKVKGGESPAACSFTQVNKTSLGYINFHISMNTPEFCFNENPTVSQTVWNAWWNIGQSWLSGTGLDGQGRHYRDLSDFGSMVGFFLTHYVTGNNDSGSYSRYSYMDRGGKMFYGPGWDFDCGFGTLTIRTRAPAVTNAMGRVRYAAIAPTGWNPGNSHNNFMGYWTSDPYFSYRMREKYMEARPYMAELVRDGGIIDRYMTNLLSSAKANDIRWSNRIGFLGDDEEKGDALMMKEFLTRRLAWLDEQFATVGKTVVKATATVCDSALRYTRNTALAIAFDGATKRESSVETDMADVALTRRSTAQVTARVTVPSSVAATAVRVYVNGFSNATWQVSSGKAVGTIPVAVLDEGVCNLIGCDAVDASGAVKARNVALLRCDRKGGVFLVR